MSIPTLGLVVKIGLLILIGVLGLFRLLAPAALRVRWRRSLVVVLALGALLAFASFWRFGDGLYGHFLHYHDISHYVFGSKYAKEVGYFNLYNAIVIAEAETIAESGHPKLPRAMRERKVRRLTDYTFQPLEDIISDVDLIARVKGRFTPDRWEQFKRDIRDFYLVQEANILYDRCNDMGYNGTPPWGFLAGGLAAHVPVTKNGMKLLALFDPVLLLAGFAAIMWAFGLEVGLILMIFFYGIVFNHRAFIHGAYLRFDWMAAILFGVAFLKRKHFRSAGVALAYAGVMRIFPVLLLFGLVVKALDDLLRRRGIRRSTWRFFGAYVLTVVLLLGGSLATFGWDYHREFIDKMEVHKEVVSSTRAGLPYITRRIGDEIQFDPQTVTANWERIERHNRGVHLLRNGVAASLIGLFVVALALILRKRDEVDALLFSYPLIFLLLGLTVYYCIVISLLALFYLRARPRRIQAFNYASLIAVMLASWILFLTIPLGVVHNFWISLAILLHLASACGLFLYAEADYRAACSRLCAWFAAAPIRRIGSAVALGLAVIFAGGVMVHAVLQVESADWQQEAVAALRIRGFVADRDVLIVTPRKLARKWRPDPAFPMQAIDAPQAETFFQAPRVWIVTNDPAFDATRFTARPHRRDLDLPLSETNGSRELRLLALSFTDGLSASWRLFDHLGDLRVELDRGDSLHPCPLRGKRYTCADNGWNYVGPTDMIVRGRLRRLLWAHPAEEALLITAPSVALGDYLHLGAALSDFAVDFGRGAPVILEAFVGDTKLGSLVQPNSTRYTDILMPTAAFKGQTRNLTFRIHTPNNARRHFAFTAEVVTQH